MAVVLPGLGLGLVSIARDVILSYPYQAGKCFGSETEYHKAVHVRSQD
jgi:hypothetical protein